MQVNRLQDRRYYRGLVIALPSLTVLLCIFAVGVRSFNSKTTRKDDINAAASRLDESRARAERTQRFHDRHRDEFCRLVVEKAKSDLSYRKLLLARTEEGVMSLNGMSHEEKTAMWRRIKDAQQAVMDAGLGDE